MVSFPEAIILGIIQGITEWFPISSSGHLVLAQKLLGLEVPISFDVALHIGSLGALIILFWKDILKLIKGFVKREKEEVKVVWFLILGTIPAAVIGLIFKNFLEATFTSMLILAIGFLGTALILFLSKFHNGSKELSWRSVIVVGFAQALSILSSFSRSGLTVSSGLIMGVRRETIARFAFLLAIPALLGAAILEFPAITNIENIPVVLVGVLVSFVVGYVSLKWLVKMIEHGKFHLFAWYNLVLGLLVLAFLLI